MAYKLLDKVTLKKGYKLGGIRKLRFDVTGQVVRIEKSEDGTEIYCIKFTDANNREFTTWIKEA